MRRGPLLISTYHIPHPSHRTPHTTHRIPHTSLSNGLGSSSSASAKGLDDEPLPSIIGMLSSVFDPFMGPYIALERKNMDDMVR